MKEKKMYSSLPIYNRYVTVSNKKDVKNSESLCYGYGLHRSEVLELQWQSVDFNENSILIRHTVSVGTKVVEKDKTKNNSSYRAFLLFPEIRELRLRLKDEENKNREFFGNAYIENEYIFKRPNGDTYDPSYITHRFGELLKKYDLPHIRFHDLRHSCASLLLSQYSLLLTTAIS